LDLLPAVLSIVLFNLILSGDNAVVIGMAAHELPIAQRRWAILFGSVVAVVLRILLTAVATLLLTIPALKIVGGLLLAWIAFRLLKVQEEETEGVIAADSLRAAIWTIVVADFIMSLDNVLAIAAVASGNIPLLIFGLLLSMPIVMFAGTLIASLLDRLLWLAYVGSGLIAWTGARMVLEDAFLDPIVQDNEVIMLIVPLLTVVVVLASSHWFHRHRIRRSAATLAEHENLIDRK